MTGQTIKRQPADLGARLLLSFFFFYTVTLPCISHSASSAEAEGEEEPVEPGRCRRAAALHCLVIMIKRCTAPWKWEGSRFVSVQSAVGRIPQETNTRYICEKILIWFFKCSAVQQATLWCPFGCLFIYLFFKKKGGGKKLRLYGRSLNQSCEFFPPREPRSHTSQIKGVITHAEGATWRWKSPCSAEYCF